MNEVILDKIIIKINETTNVSSLAQKYRTFYTYASNF